MVVDAGDRADMEWLSKKGVRKGIEGYIQSHRSHAVCRRLSYPIHRDPPLVTGYVCFPCIRGILALN